MQCCPCGWGHGAHRWSFSILELVPAAPSFNQANKTLESQLLVLYMLEYNLEAYFVLGGLRMKNKYWYSYPMSESLMWKKTFFSLISISRNRWKKFINSWQENRQIKSSKTKHYHCRYQQCLAPLDNMN